MDSAKESVIESLDLRAGGGDVECPAGAHGHPPTIDTLLCAGRDRCTCNVSGLKAKVALDPLAVPNGKAVRVETRHLAISVAGGRDQQRAHAAHVQRLGRAGPDAGGIVPVGLLQPQAGTVELRAPAGADLHGQAGGDEVLIHSPAGRVDRCSVLQWAAGLRLDVRVAELLGGLRAFLDVARLAREREVGDAVGAAPRPREDVLDLQGCILRAAVGAAATPLFEEILTHLVAGQRALLILDAADLGVLTQLRVEAHQLGADGRDWHHAQQPSDPGERRIDPMLERRGQPALGPPPVEEAGLAVAGLALSPTAAAGPPTEQGVADGLSSVGQLARPDDAPGRASTELAEVFSHHRDPGGLAARVELQPMGVGDALGGEPVFEDDGERVAPKDGGPPLLQQQARPPVAGGVERLPVVA